MRFNQLIKIGHSTIEQNSPVFIIAEAGVNHNGYLQKAIKLIDCAVAAGADAVKFQAFKTEKLILPSVAKAPYQKKTTSSSESQFDMLKKLEISLSDNIILQRYCRRKKIIFLTTPFDEYSLEEIDSLDLEAYKISSTDVTNIPFLKKVARKGKPIILSTGMADMKDVGIALRILYPLNKNIILLQCTANYPIADYEANLRVLRSFQDQFKILVGFSDHSVGIGAGPYAAATGAVVIEKHFSLDKNHKGPDQKASLSPSELKQFVRQIRQVEIYLGSGEKKLTASEKETRQSLQKCLVALRSIGKGERFSTHNVIAKRTGGVGLSPQVWERLMGGLSTRSYNKDDIIRERL